MGDNTHRGKAVETRGILQDFFQPGLKSFFVFKADVAKAMGSPFILVQSVDGARRTQPATPQSSLFHEREENRH